MGSFAGPASLFHAHQNAGSFAPITRAGGMLKMVLWDEMAALLPCIKHINSASLLSRRVTRLQHMLMSLLHRECCGAIGIGDV